MMCTFKKFVAFLVVVCVVSHGLPRCTPATPTSSASQALPPGAATSRQAAALHLPTYSHGAASTSHVSSQTIADAVSAGQPVLAFGALNPSAEPDTSEFEFPGEENEHLVRDIAVWVVVAAFVAFFIVKVFIEDSDDEPEDEGPPGKQI